MEFVQIVIQGPIKILSLSGAKKFLPLLYDAIGISLVLILPNKVSVVMT